MGYKLFQNMWMAHVSSSLHLNRSFILQMISVLWLYLSDVTFQFDPKNFPFYFTACYCCCCRRRCRRRWHFVTHEAWLNYLCRTFWHTTLLNTFAEWLKEKYSNFLLCNPERWKCNILEWKKKPKQILSHRNFQPNVE